MERREFLNRLGRYTILGGLLAILGVAIHQNLTNEEDCSTNEFCAACKKLDKCDLPKAKDYRGVNH